MEEYRNRGRFAGEVDIIARSYQARKIGDIALRASLLTDDFSNIQRIPRLADGRRENDVEHSYALAIAAPAIAEQYYPHLDVNKIREFALVHDLLEVEVGDVATFDLSATELEEKDRREQVAKQIVLRRLSEISPQSALALEQYEQQDTDEAVFVRMVDKLLPVAVDVTGDGLAVTRDDYGVTSLGELEESHNQLYARIATKFGKRFPNLVAAHATLIYDFE